MVISSIAHSGRTILVKPSQIPERFDMEVWEISELVDHDEEFLCIEDAEEAGRISAETIPAYQLTLTLPFGTIGTLPADAGMRG